MPQRMWILPICHGAKRVYRQCSLGKEKSSRLVQKEQHRCIHESRWICRSHERASKAHRTGLSFGIYKCGWEIICPWKKVKLTDAVTHTHYHACKQRKQRFSNLWLHHLYSSCWHIRFCKFCLLKIRYSRKDNVVLSTDRLDLMWKSQGERPKIDTNSRIIQQMKGKKQ